MNMQALIDEYLLRESQEPRQRSGCFSPSSFGQCLRRQTFNRMNKEKTNPPDTRALRIFRVGHMYHQFVYDILTKLGTNVRFEVEVKQDDIHGFADIVNDDTVYDIKSVHSRKFWYMKPKEIVSGEVGEERRKETWEEFMKRMEIELRDNILQVMSYCYFLNKPYGKLVFISKDDLCMADFTFELKDWKDAVNDELIILRKWWRMDYIPPAIPKLYKKGNTFKECEYCAWKDLCKSMPTSAVQR